MLQTLQDWPGHWLCELYANKDTVLIAANSQAIDEYRNYNQEEVIAFFQKGFLSGKRLGVLMGPMGSGKTQVLAELAKHNSKVWVWQHQKGFDRYGEAQLVTKAWNNGYKTGIEARTYEDLEEVIEKAAELDDYLLLIDEIHFAAINPDMLGRFVKILKTHNLRALLAGLDLTFLGKPWQNTRYLVDYGEMVAVMAARSTVGEKAAWATRRRVTLHDGRTRPACSLEPVEIVGGITNGVVGTHYEPVSLDHFELWSDKKAARFDRASSVPATLTIGGRSFEIGEDIACQFFLPYLRKKKHLRSPYPRIEIAGDSMRSGKTTTMKVIETALQKYGMPVQRREEEYYHNPFLVESYTGEDKSVALRLSQEWFIQRKYEQVATEFEGITIQDVTPEMDFIYALANLYMGTLHPDDFLVYWRFFLQLDWKELNRPDLLIYLSSTNETLISRAQAAAREFERKIDPDYYLVMRKLNRKWLKGLDREWPVLFINTDAFDFSYETGSDEARSELVKRVVVKLTDLGYAFK